MTDLVGNPEDRFSCDAGHLLKHNVKSIFGNYCELCEKVVLNAPLCKRTFWHFNCSLNNTVRFV